MALTDRWKRLFSAEVRRRGRQYHSEGRVELIEPGPGETVRAQVQGNEMYIVALGSADDDATASCTCPHFRQGTYCKHLWATLLEVQQRSRVGAPGAGGAAMHVLAEAEAPPLPKARKREGSRAEARPATPEWMDRLTLLRRAMVDRSETAAAPITPATVYYILNAPLSARCGAIVIELRQRQPTRSGWGALKALRLDRTTREQLTHTVDRQIIAMLVGASFVDEIGYEHAFNDPSRSSMFCLEAAAQRTLLRRIIETGRCHLAGEPADRRDRRGDELGPALRWGGDEAWDLWMTAQPAEDEGLIVTTELRRGERKMNVTEPDVLVGGEQGVVVIGDEAWPLNDHEARAWAEHFRRERWSAGDGAPIHVPAEGVATFLDRLYALPQLPPLDLPPGVGRQQRYVEPVAHLDLGATVRNNTPAVFWFDYEGRRVAPDSPGRFVEADQASADLLLRDRAREREAQTLLFELGLRPEPSQGADAWTLGPRQVPGVVGTLLGQGWIVRAEERTIRAAAAPRLSITSGIDWFELHGQVEFTTEHGSEQVSLPDILKAARAGRKMITLSDGSTGLLPDQWLAQHGLLAALGRVEKDHLRFGAAQAALLDVLIDPAELAEVDARFEALRQRLRAFDKIEPIDPAESFRGDLRAYQREGLGWLSFLAQFGFGGILADDMGLGKTIQVLALLDRRRALMPELAEGEKRWPCLVVAPKSVLFNWADEAAKFTPHLRIATYSGADRATIRPHLHDYDLIITSYGILRRDVAEFKDITFDYVVLDEAQAIKNPRSKSARAARAVKATHRLALTGTPVENHLGDLWSIFEFLNPGMLGSGTRFDEAVRGGASDPSRLETAQQAAGAMRPFILRRTKKQVLTELPPKTEQTIVCQMGAAQRRVYEQLRDYYRGSVLGVAGTTPTSNGGAMIVLEALLRLRQAACHPGLIDAKRSDAPSAKLDALLEQLEELIAEGHKALVFSQFTSMLALVRKSLDERNVTYEYLDGQTRDRKERIDRFQNDPNCPLFLISLKAGGLGLNLTAAQYVFILDPWWNPAVEAQAIDRAHRIGQTQHVTAYRLVCADTVEQRIIELQDKKRQLADAIVAGQENLLSQLTREDLERLLS